MLYDKRWDKTEVKADPFSLESLIAWLEKQPAATKYDFYNCTKCLVGRYVTAVTGSDEPAQEVIYQDLFESFDQYVAVAATKPWTFGAALERASAGQ